METINIYYISLSYKYMSLPSSSLSQLNALQGTQSSRARTTRPIGAKETKLKKASYRHRQW